MKKGTLKFDRVRLGAQSVVSAAGTLSVKFGRGTSLTVAETAHRWVATEANFSDARCEFFYADFAQPFPITYIVIRKDQKPKICSDIRFSSVFVLLCVSNDLKVVILKNGLEESKNF
ncbi:hypothetical protein GWI33_004975 [Rhynchophorus ferrugineus]|uniref:Uncharacterized protein n=1 Tax=Rhynchophorus ferrugineus TaxID=354439 RepID=A0A834ILE2_RHYFE|nr:hypothetical protein GWI33_004975 [Rhynchophorus ferrugineus]